MSKMGGKGKNNLYFIFAFLAIILVAVILVYFYNSSAKKALNDNLTNELEINNASKSIYASSGLVGYWNLDGSVNDSSGYNNNGEIVGNASFIRGIKGLAGDFNGIDSYFSIPDSDSLTMNRAVTISAFVYAREFTSDDMIFHKGGEYGLWYSNAFNDMGPFIAENTDEDEFSFVFYNRGNYPMWFLCDSNFKPKIKTWYHIAATYDSKNGECKFYVNGKLSKITNYNNLSILQSTSRPVRIGGYPEASYDFNGLVDEARIYNRPLSEKEIESIYNFIIE